jgi:hypothetical protein
MTENELWEYRVESFGGAIKSIKDEELQAALDEWGEEGWEVISLIQTSSSNKVRIVAKRRLDDRARRRRSMPGS